MFDFNTLLDKYLEREQRFKQVGRYYPSEAGNCLRKAWYSYKQPKPVEPELVRVFEAGNIIHAFVVEVLKSEKTPGVKLVATELPFKLEHNGYVISGRVDDIIVLEEKGHMLVVEVKSTSSLSYMNEPSESHVLQLQLYLKATGINDGALLYLEKNTLQCKVFPVTYDEAKVGEAFTRFSKLHEDLVSGALPEAEAKLRHSMTWMCKTCPWRKECDAAGLDAKR